MACRDGVLIINKVSADDDELVTLYVVSDRMGEGDCLTVIDKRDINASPLENSRACFTKKSSISLPYSAFFVYLQS